MDKYDNPREAWGSPEARKLRAESMAEFVALLAEWKTFLTLTCARSTKLQYAEKLFNRLVFELNRQCVGGHYKRKVKGESYFSYVASFEYQHRNVIHIHILVDKPIDVDLVHLLWKKWAGTAHIEHVRSPDDASRYVTKISYRDGPIHVYKARINYVPKAKPNWWPPALSTASMGKGEVN
jgi:hypothetical protein